MSEVEHVPTFLLRGISHDEIWKEYCQGYFCQITKINGSQINMVGSNLDSGRSDPDSISNIKTRSNHTMTVLMTGATQVKDINGNNLKPGGLCKWTREKIIGIPVGIPISTRYDPSKNIITYIVVKEFVNFECAFAYLNRILKKNGDSGIYANSSVLLRNWFKSCYPNDKLEEAQDFELHENWGGPMNSYEFHNNPHEYFNVSNIKVIPAQLQYMEINR